MKQWAADSSQRSPTTVAPQKCWEPSFRLACQGTSPEAAPNPPTTRVGFSMAGLVPHSRGRGEEGPGISPRRVGAPGFRALGHTVAHSYTHATGRETKADLWRPEVSRQARGTAEGIRVKGEKVRAPACAVQQA